MLDSLILLIYGVAAGLLASIPLGPIGILCIQRTISSSRTTGFISGLGAATADTCFAALAVFALGWITGFITEYQLWVEAFGGLLVVAFGLSLYFKKVQKPAIVKDGSFKVKKSKHVADYFSVLFLTLPNPAYFFVFTAIFAAMGIGVESIDSVNKLLIILGVILGASLWWFFLTWIVSRFRKKITMRTMVKINKISGAAIAALGAYAVLAVVYQLITKLIESGKL